MAVTNLHNKLAYTVPSVAALFKGLGQNVFFSSSFLVNRTKCVLAISQRVD